MACFHPLPAIKKRGLNTFHIGREGDVFTPYVDYSTGQLIEPIKINCGKCIGCRLDYSRSWADRCVLEAKMHESNWFVTLTYDDDHLVTEKRSLISDKGTLSLYPKDLQDFLKRLRIHWEREHNWKKDLIADDDPSLYANPGIRFYGCGEYGSSTFRPHYHLLLFNFPIFDLKFFFANELGDPVYLSDEIQSIWSHGQITVGEFNWETAAYTARYVMKKQKGKGAAEYYENAGLVPEFSRMSRNPGIGRSYYDLYKDSIYKEFADKRYQASIILPNGRETNPPKYFDKIHSSDHEEMMNFLKDQRRNYAELSLRTSLAQADLDERGYFKAKEEYKNYSIKALTRFL